MLTTRVQRQRRGFWFLYCVRHGVNPRRIIHRVLLSSLQAELSSAQELEPSSDRSEGP